MIHDFLVDCRKDKHIKTSLDAVERILFTTAKHCLEIKNIIKRYTRVLTKNGLIKNVVLRRQELRKLSNLKHRDPLNITLREKYYIVLKQYKNVPKQKRKECYHTKISELENIVDNSNSRNFWTCPKSMAESLRYFIFCTDVVLI